MTTILDPYFEIGTQISITLSMVFFIYGIHLRIPKLYKNIKQIFVKNHLHHNPSNSIAEFSLNIELYKAKHKTSIVKYDSDFDFVAEMSAMNSSSRIYQSINNYLKDSIPIYCNPIIPEEIISTLKAEGQIFLEKLKVKHPQPGQQIPKNPFEHEGNFTYLPS